MSNAGRSYFYMSFSGGNDNFCRNNSYLKLGLTDVISQGGDNI